MQDLPLARNPRKSLRPDGVPPEYPGKVKSPRDREGALNLSGAAVFLTLDGSLGIERPAQRPGSGKRETHVPEIRIRRNKLNPDVSLTLAVMLHGDHSGLHRPVAAFIHKNQHLPHDHGLIELQERPVAVHRLRLGLHAELIAVLILTVHGYRHRDTYSQRAAPLFTSKMKYGHARREPLGRS